ncbi:hypothetical protein [Sphingobacterium deserti]|nr:hypothetical protein [Sphingobacterium deserti]
MTRQRELSLNEMGIHSNNNATQPMDGYTTKKGVAIQTTPV